MSKQKFYAVAVGLRPGLYATWEECQAQVSGFSGAKYKKFKDRAEAEQYVKANRAGPDNLSPRKTIEKKHTPAVKGLNLSNYFAKTQPTTEKHSTSSPIRAKQKFYETNREVLHPMKVIDKEWLLEHWK